MEANFQTKKISKHREKTEHHEIPNIRKRKKLSPSLTILISLSLIAILIVGIFKALANIDYGSLLKAAGDSLMTDSYGHTNFLIMGIGGKNHEGSDLTDTIVLASLDEEDKKLSMISIPRDLYVKDNISGGTRINEIYYYAKNYYEDSKKGLEYTKERIEELFGIPIHYWLKIDFHGFKEIVDTVGGIDVYVENSIYDPFYPKDGTYLYEPFSISKGQHHMDGETALKYSRSRKTTSDFDRANRQQQVIYAIKEKALQTEIIFSMDKIEKLFNTLKENIETNITPKEILTLGAIAKDYKQNQITHRLIHDDPNLCGGFLYTPSLEAYGGFVLLPAGGENYLRWYGDLMLNLQQINPETTKIHILNGTSSGGTAGETKQVLKRYCFEVVRHGNARTKTIEETTYFYTAANPRPQALDFLKKLIPGKESTNIPQEYLEYFPEANIVIEIGSDYTSSENYIEDPFFYLPPPVQSTESTETDESTEVTGTNETQ